MTVEIRALLPADDRSAFRSGDEALDLYLHRYAGQHQFRHHIGVTYVVIDERILGFVTLTAATLDADDLPGGRHMPPFPLPVLRIARLATAEEARGVGLDRALLRFSIELAEAMRDRLGCVGLLVDAKPQSIAFYERYGFTALQLHQGFVEARPRPVPLFLPLGSVPPPR